MKGGEDLCMLGGGQPSHIPEMSAVWRRRLQEILDAPGVMEKMLGNYDPPRGHAEFIASLAGLMRRTFGWDIGPENIAVTAGGQTAFFMLFNALGGQFPGGSRRRILLPLVPEYIGYADQSINGRLFEGKRPRIDLGKGHEFKYHVDFDQLEIGDHIAAMCVSRPTNPTGNVLTDEEVRRLSEIAKSRGIPLIIDNAYGAPFPNIIFREVTPVWDENIILTLSLSKIGLPGTRTGIVIAKPEIASAITAMTSVVGLANGNVGQAIMQPLMENGEILRLSNEIVRPFYLKKLEFARSCLDDAFGEDFEWRVHQSEGALFVWLWFPNLPISSRELYERLKKRGVLVVRGNYFFYGLDQADENWKHRDECIRVTYTMDESTVQRGLAIIGDEVRRAWAERRG
jgi:valine--pyruvate aminotransferase